MKHDTGPRCLACNFLLLAVALFMFSGLCFGQPAVTLNIKTGPPTSAVLVSGSGFSPSAEIDIYFDSTFLSFTNANGSGAFSKFPIAVPSTASPGRHWISAEQVSTDTGAKAAFNINTNWSEFGFRRSGDRHNPYENLLDTNNVGGLILKWFYPTGSPVGQSSPAVVNGVVYFGSNALYALNAATGSQLWSFQPGAGEGVANSPAVVPCSAATCKAAGTSYEVIFGSTYPNHNVYALGATTGAVLWQFTTGGAVVSSPVVVDGVVYIGSEDSNVYALNAGTGAKLWQFTTGSSVSSSPVVVDGVVYIMSDFDELLYAVNAGTGVWQFPLANSEALDFLTSPAVANGVVYAPSIVSNLYAVNAATGVELWQWTFADGGGGYSSPALANGVVYVGSGYGNVYAVNAATGVQLWQFLTAGPSIDSTPAVANGVVYVGSFDNNVYGLSASTGAPLWSYTTGGEVESSPTVANGVVYVGSDDGNMYAFALPDDTDVKPIAPPALSSLHRPSSAK